MRSVNLLFLLARRLDWSMVGWNGNCISDTDAIDTLAEESVRITCAVSGEPAEASCRSALLWGRYHAPASPKPEETPFAAALQSAGYAVQFSGGWNRPEHAPLSPDAQTEEALGELDALSRSHAPFALFCDFDAPGDGTLPDLALEDDLAPFRDRWFRPAPSFGLNVRSVPKGQRLTQDRLAEENERRKVRFAMLSALDRSVERLLSRVDELGLARDTLVVFCSDGGLFFGEHGRAGSDWFYEEAVRTPLYLRQTMTLTPGDVPVCLSSADMMNTVLSLMNVPVPEKSAGHDFAPAILEGTADTSPALICGKGYAALREEDFVLCREDKRGTVMLFDLRTDPYQLIDLAKDSAHARRRREMEHTLNILCPDKHRRKS